jgi:hypothetical protein
MEEARSLFHVNGTVSEALIETLRLSTSESFSYKRQVAQCPAKTASTEGFAIKAVGEVERKGGQAHG